MRRHAFDPFLPMPKLWTLWDLYAGKIKSAIIFNWSALSEKKRKDEEMHRFIRLT